MAQDTPQTLRENRLRSKKAVLGGLVTLGLAGIVYIVLYYSFSLPLWLLLIVVGVVLFTILGDLINLWYISSVLGRRSKQR